MQDQANDQDDAERHVLDKDTVRIVAFGSDQTNQHKRHERGKQVVTDHKRYADDAGSYQNPEHVPFKNGKDRCHSKQQHHISTRYHQLAHTPELFHKQRSIHTLILKYRLARKNKMRATALYYIWISQKNKFCNQFIILLQKC